VLRHDLRMSLLHDTPGPATEAVRAVLLAAGSASRMGLRPKCLLQRDGTPLVVRLIQQLHRAGVADVVVVLGHYADRIGAALDAMPDCPGLQLHRVLNPDPDAPQDASLRRGLAALPEETGTVLVLLADQPLLTSDDVTLLLSVWAQRAAGVGFLQPEHAGQPGHPVVMSWPVAKALRDAPPGQGGRQWQQANARSVWRWQAPHERFSTDVDRPDDIERLAQAGVALQWPPQ